MKYYQSSWFIWFLTLYFRYKIEIRIIPWKEKKMFVKQNVSKEEYRLQRLASSYVNVPEIFHYDPKKKVMTMEKLGINVADMYGDDVPAYLFEEMQKIIRTLFEHGIYYPDITGYNFIESEKGVYLIDFGHATQKTIDPFIYDFMNGHCAWNPRFK